MRIDGKRWLPPADPEASPTTDRPDASRPAHDLAPDFRPTDLRPVTAFAVAQRSLAHR